MSCYHPLQGWLSAERTEKGKRKVVFDRLKAWSDFAQPITVACGQCIGCRLDKSLEWATRCYLEAKEYNENCFITLTFNQENLPKDGSLHKQDFQKFIKRLRKYFSTHANGRKVRYFHCGEYGESLTRPHHHACLFGIDFKDKILWSTIKGVKLYRSKTLEKLWSFGYSTVGDVTFESASYIARYTTKKFTNKEQKLVDEHYSGKLPEYISMSTNPGIGKAFYEKYKKEIYPHDTIVIKRGNSFHNCMPSSYFDKKLEIDNPMVYTQIKERRVHHALNNPDNTPTRLAQRELCKLKQKSMLKRSYENETTSV